MFFRLRFHNLVAAVLLLVFVGVSHLPAQVIEQSDIPSPLLDEVPFDLIYMDDASDNTIMRIKPIEGIKTPLRKKGMLRFEYLVGSDFILQVPLDHVDRYLRFNDLLLLEADQFLRENDFASALRNLLHVYDTGNQNNTRMPLPIFSQVALNWLCRSLNTSTIKIRVLVLRTFPIFWMRF